MPVPCHAPFAKIDAAVGYAKSAPDFFRVRVVLQERYLHAKGNERAAYVRIDNFVALDVENRIVESFLISFCNGRNFLFQVFQIEQPVDVVKQVLIFGREIFR